MVHKCGVAGCSNSRDKPGKTPLRFFSVPKDEQIFLAWQRACGQPLDRKGILCSNHFSPEAISLKDRLLNTPLKKCRLDPNALPTLNVVESASDEAAVVLDGRKEIEARKQLVAELVKQHDKENEERTQAENDSNHMDQHFSPGMHLTDPLANVIVPTHKCRLCLEEITKGGGNLFEDDSSTSLAKFLKKSFQIKLENKPNWPHLACEDCLSFIQDIRVFRNRIFNTNILLMHEIVAEPEIILPEEEPQVNHDDFDIDTDSEDEQSERNSLTETSHDEEGTVPIPLKRIRGPPQEIKDPTGDLFISKMAKNLKKHKRLSIDLDLLECVICGDKSESSEDLIKHSFTVHDLDISRIKVQCCDRKFAVLMDLSDHLPYHLDPETFKCNVCGKDCLSNERLRSHKLSHSGEPLKCPCPTCGKVFRTSKSLRVHRQSHSKKYLCGDCAKVFATSEQLRLHIQQVHDIKNRAVCELCGKAFSTKKTMMEHSKKCGKAPKKKRQFKIRAIEEDLRPVSCVFCKKDVPCAKLSDHAREEHGKRWIFLCKDCPVQFFSMKELGAHREKEHDGLVLQFDCPYCDKKFKYSQAKNNHIKREHPDKYQPRKRKRKTQDVVEESLDDLFLKK